MTDLIHHSRCSAAASFTKRPVHVRALNQGMVTVQRWQKNQRGAGAQA